MPNFTVDDQIKNLSDEQLDQMISQTEQIRKDSLAQSVSGSLASGAKGMLLASQGRPISELQLPQNNQFQSLR